MRAGLLAAAIWPAILPDRFDRWGRPIPRPVAVEFRSTQRAAQLAQENGAAYFGVVFNDGAQLVRVA